MSISVQSKDQNVSGEVAIAGFPLPIIALSNSGEIIAFSDEAFQIVKSFELNDLKCGDPFLGLFNQDYRSIIEDELISLKQERIKLKFYINDQVSYLSLRLKPVQGNKAISFFVFIENVTAEESEKRESEVEKRELKEAMLARDTFLSIISHDLRSPIFQFNSLLHQIEIAGQNQDLSKVQAYAGDLEERIFHLTNVMENLLRWVTINPNEFKPRMIDFDAGAILRSNMELLSPLAESKGVRYELEVDSPISVCTDRELFSFFIRNFISNALKYSNANDVIHVSLNLDNSHLFFSVKDHGVGIDKKTLSAVQDPKQYFTQPGTSGEHGTGLGIKLCYQFAHLLNGEIEIDTAVGEGTKIQLILPLE